MKEENFVILVILTLIIILSILLLSILDPIKYNNTINVKLYKKEYIPLIINKGNISSNSEILNYKFYFYYNNKKYYIVINEKQYNKYNINDIITLSLYKTILFKRNIFIIKE